EHPPRLHVLPAAVHEAPMRADGPRRDDHALDEAVRVALHEIAVLERAGLTLVGVDDEIAGGCRPLGNEAPLDAGREGRTAQPTEIGLLDLLRDGGRFHAEGFGERAVATRLLVTREGVRVRDMEVAGEDLLGHQWSPSRMRSTVSLV